MNDKQKKIALTIMGILTLITTIVILTTKNEIGMALVAPISYIFISIILLKTNFLNTSWFLYLMIAFPFVGKVLANSLNFYAEFQYYDKFLHLLSGFLTVGAAVNLIKFSKELSELSLKLKYFFTFLISCSVAALWEIFEFSSDTFLNTDLQKKGNVDSMTDMILPIAITVMLILIHAILKKLSRIDK